MVAVAALPDKSVPSALKPEILASNTLPDLAVLAVSALPVRSPVTSPFKSALRVPCVTVRTPLLEPVAVVNPTLNLWSPSSKPINALLPGWRWIIKPESLPSSLSLLVESSIILSLSTEFVLLIVVVVPLTVKLPVTLTLLATFKSPPIPTPPETTNAPVEVVLLVVSLLIATAPLKTELLLTSNSSNLAIGLSEPPIRTPSIVPPLISTEVKAPRDVISVLSPLLAADKLVLAPSALLALVPPLAIGSKLATFVVKSIEPANIAFVTEPVSVVYTPLVTEAALPERSPIILLENVLTPPIVWSSTIKTPLLSLIFVLVVWSAFCSILVNLVLSLSVIILDNASAKVLPLFAALAVAALPLYSELSALKPDNWVSKTLPDLTALAVSALPEISALTLLVKVLTPPIVWSVSSSIICKEVAICCLVWLPPSVKVKSENPISVLVIDNSLPNLLKPLPAEIWPAPENCVNSIGVVPNVIAPVLLHT